MDALAESSEKETTGLNIDGSALEKVKTEGSLIL
jgi:hypothetical protein